MGPYQGGLWEISRSSREAGALLPFLSDGAHVGCGGERMSLIWDYLHKGDYSNHLIPALWEICSVKRCISISPDNCVQRRLHQYHYSLHCFTQTTLAWLMNRQKTVYSRNSRKSITHAKEACVADQPQYSKSHTFNGTHEVSHSVRWCDNQLLMH